MAIPLGLSDAEFLLEFRRMYPNFPTNVKTREDQGIPTTHTDGSPLSPEERNALDQAINSLNHADRRNEQFRRLLGQGRLGEAGKVPEEISPSESLLDNINSIANLDLALRSPEVPEEDREYLDAQRTGFRSFLERMEPVAPDPSIRQSLIDQFTGESQRLLDNSQAAEFGTLNQRGLIPSRVRGASTPAENVLGQLRATLYEEPVLRYTTDLDVALEQARIQDLQQIRELQAGGYSSLLDEGNTFAQALLNADVDSLGTARDFVSELSQANLSSRLEELKLAIAQEQYEREQRIDAQTADEQRTALNEQNSGGFGLGSGTLSGAMSGGSAGYKIGGPWGALVGGIIGGAAGSYDSGGSSRGGSSGGGNSSGGNTTYNFNSGSSNRARTYDSSGNDEVRRGILVGGKTSGNTRLKRLS